MSPTPEEREREKERVREEDESVAAVSWCANVLSYLIPFRNLLDGRRGRRKRRRKRRRRRTHSQDREKTRQQLQYGHSHVTHTYMYSLTHTFHGLQCKAICLRKELHLVEKHGRMFDKHHLILTLLKNKRGVLATLVVLLHNQAMSKVSFYKINVKYKRCMQP